MLLHLPKLLLAAALCGSAPPSTERHVHSSECSKGISAPDGAVQLDDRLILFRSTRQSMLP